MFMFKYYSFYELNKQVIKNDVNALKNSFVQYKNMLPI